MQLQHLGCLPQPQRQRFTASGCDFASGAAALRRGYNVLAFDGPGQGAVILEQGVPFRPDWETVVKVVVDYALTLPEVDPVKLVLLGWSFGGYLAPRAAAKEHRLATCISDCGPYDLGEASMERVPAFLPGGFPMAIAYPGAVEADTSPDHEAPLAGLVAAPQSPGAWYR